MMCSLYLYYRETSFHIFFGEDIIAIAATAILLQSAAVPLSQLWLIVVATPYPITPHIPTNGRMINSGFWMRDRNALSSPICKSTVDTVGDGSVILQ